MTIDSQVRKQLSALVDDDTLAGIIDSELTKARNNIHVAVSQAVSDVLKTRVKAALERANEERTQLITELVDQAIVNLIKHKISECTTNNWEFERLIRDRIGENVKRHAQQIIENKIQTWPESSEYKEFSEKLTTDLIPRIMGHTIAEIANNFVQNKLHAKM